MSDKNEAQFLYNLTKMKSRRRELRARETATEKRLWSQLRGKLLNGSKWFRQYSVGCYILDFYCPHHRIAVELDGGYHTQDDVKEYDVGREQFLQGQDIRVLRFWNDDIINNLDKVVQKIIEAMRNT